MSSSEKCEVTQNFFSWLQKDHTKCIFARNLSRDHEAFGWHSAVIRETPSPEVVEILDAAIDSCCRRGMSATQAIFPLVDTPEKLIGLLEALDATDFWYLQEIRKYQRDDALHIGLRRIMPDKKHVAWVLGFAPFWFMPETRQAPYTAIIMRVSGPGRIPGVVKGPERPGKENGLLPIHLADMDYLNMEDEQLKKTWTATEDRVRQAKANSRSLGGAAARVAFTFPVEFRARLAPLFREHNSDDQ